MLVSFPSWIPSWGWPVVFGYAGPEIPDGDDGQECEQCLEQRSVDLSVGTIADMGADDILEDLANGKKEDGAGEVAHWPLLAQDSEDKNGLQDDKDEQKDEWGELVEIGRAHV